MFDNKNAQIGTAMTWLVATIIIFIVVLFFIYGTFLIAQEKSISVDSVGLVEDKENLDLSAVQTTNAFLIANTDKGFGEPLVSEAERVFLSVYPALEGGFVGGETNPVVFGTPSSCLEKSVKNRILIEYEVKNSQFIFCILKKYLLNLNNFKNE